LFDFEVLGFGTEAFQGVTIMAIGFLLFQGIFKLTL
jgi:hypothetical protein